MAAENISRALVFEDDAILSADFRAAILDILKAAATLAPGHLIFLGGADTKLPPDFLTYPAPLAPRRMTTTGGFVIDNALIRRRLEWLKHKGILPADGLMHRIDQDIGAPNFWPKRTMVQQASCAGQLKTTLDGSRSKHGLLYIKLRYRWRKFKNQSIRRWLKTIWD